VTDIAFKIAWDRRDQALMDEVKAFWTASELMVPRLLDERAGQLGVVACDGDRIVATATAELAVLPGLRARFAVISIAVDPQSRRKSIGLRISGRFLTVLEEWSAAHPEEEVMGMAAVIEGDWGAKMHEPIWPDWGLNIVLAGYTHRNQQIRISWFRHARV